MKRREVLRAALGLAAAGAAAELRLTGQAAEANDRITVAVMGVRGRGGGLLTTFAAQSDVDVKYICDVDAKTLDSRVKQIQDMTGKRPINSGIMPNSRISSLVACCSRSPFSISSRQTPSLATR